MGNIRSGSESEMKKIERKEKMDGLYFRKPFNVHTEK